VLCGCVSISSEFGSFTSIKYPAKTENQEVLLLTSTPNKPYKEIGVIKVEAIDEGVSLDQINAEIIKKARAVGADAVINLQYGGGETMNGMVMGGKRSNMLTMVSNKHAQGTAIVFTDNK